MGFLLNSTCAPPDGRKRMLPHSSGSQIPFVVFLTIIIAFTGIFIFPRRCASQSRNEEDTNSQQKGLLHEVTAIASTDIPTNLKNQQFPRHANKEETIRRRMDPFFAALVECSKEDGDQASERNLWTGAKVTRSVSDRFGFITLSSSCKRICAVSE